MAKVNRASTKKYPFPWIMDKDNYNGRLILADNDLILDYIRDNVLKGLEPGQEVTITLGVTKLTGKQFENLPDIETL